MANEQNPLFKNAIPGFTPQAYGYNPYQIGKSFGGTMKELAFLSYKRKMEEAAAEKKRQQEIQDKVNVAMSTQALSKTDVVTPEGVSPSLQQIMGMAKGDYGTFGVKPETQELVDTPIYMSTSNDPSAPLKVVGSWKAKPGTAPRIVRAEDMALRLRYWMDTTGADKDMEKWRKATEAETKNRGGYVNLEDQTEKANFYNAVLGRYDLDIKATTGGGVKAEVEKMGKVPVTYVVDELVTDASGKKNWIKSEFEVPASSATAFEQQIMDNQWGILGGGKGQKIYGKFERK